MYLSSGAVMDGLVFGPWQAGGRMGERGPYREGATAGGTAEGGGEGGGVRCCRNYSA